MSDFPRDDRPSGSGWQPQGGGSSQPGPAWQQPSQPPSQGGGYQPPAYGSQQQPGPAAAGGQLAQWWKRLLAIIIDGLILGVPFGILAAIVAGAAANEATIDPITGEIESGGGALTGAVVLIYAVALIANVLYYGLLNGGASGQTLGKKILNIRVRDANTGGPIGVGRGIGRYFVSLILGFACGIGTILDALWPLWDQRNQALHDKAVNSLVVDA